MRPLNGFVRASDLGRLIPRSKDLFRPLVGTERVWSLRPWLGQFTRSPLGTGGTATLRFDVEVDTRYRLRAAGPAGVETCSVDSWLVCQTRFQARQSLSRAALDLVVTFAVRVLPLAIVPLDRYICDGRGTRPAATVLRFPRKAIWGTTVPRLLADAATRGARISRGRVFSLPEGPLRLPGGFGSAPRCPKGLPKTS